MKTTTELALAGGLLLLSSGLALAAPASENWDNNCASCHGSDGKGDTKQGRKLKVKDYTDANVQAALKDDEMIKAITDGIKGDNGKEKMKGFKDELSADEIKDLLAYVRKFKA